MTKEYWEEIYKNEKLADYHGELDLFLSALKTGKVLDLGCGNGGAANFLTEQGIEVLACDASLEALKNVQTLNPEIEVCQLDLQESLPFADESFQSILANLSLHYFSEKQTKQILAEIHRVLRPQGLLIAAVNSTKDVNSGAGQGKEIEPHFYLKNGNFKRFFDENELKKYFFTENWLVKSSEEKQELRFGKEKIFWQVVLEKVN